MRPEVQSYLQGRPDLLRFVREQPQWYRILTRDPYSIYNIEEHSRVFYGQTFSQKVGKVNESLQMFSMLMSMLGSMNDQN